MSLVEVGAFPTHSAHLQCAVGTVLKADRDLSRIFAAVVVGSVGTRAPLDETRGDASDLGDFSQQPAGDVEPMAPEIAEHSRAGEFGVEPPAVLARAREAGEVPHVEMKRLADEPIIDQPLDVLVRRHVPVRERDECDRPLLSCPRRHALRSLNVRRDRLLAQDMQSSVERGQGEGFVTVVGRGDDDRVDPFRVEKLVGVGRRPRDRPLSRQRLGGCSRASAHADQFGIGVSGQGREIHRVDPPTRSEHTDAYRHDARSRSLEVDMGDPLVRRTTRAGATT